MAGTKVDCFKDVNIQKIILYVILIPVSLFLLDYVYNTCFGELFKAIGNVASAIVLVIIWFLYGIGISELIYKFKKYFLILTLSIGNLFILRFLMLIIFTKSALLYAAMIITFIESIFVLFSAIVFSLLFKYSETKFEFAEVSIIPHVGAPSVKEKYEFGICGKCNDTIKISKNGIFGSRRIHSCEKCGAFLGENPFKASITGLAESIASFLLLLGFGMHISASASESSGTHGIYYLVLLLGVFDGLRRLFSGIKGVIGSKKMKT